MTAIAEWLESVAAPWIDFYSGSAATETAVMFLHIGALVAAGGLAFTLDRAVLRQGHHGWPSRADLARDRHQSHRAVIIGLGVVFASGFALTLADPAVFLVSLVYWAKMTAVALLLVNGFFLQRSGERLLSAPEDEASFQALRRAALRSAALWGLSILGGVAVTMYA